ncbi:MAG: helix-turn-helix transcriptional regulator [Bdellovibrionota bacterium]|nr:helix-turn-helix transcriptional regulator [Bdellovibrionota bacterium]
MKEITEVINQDYISNNAIILKKMRLLKRLNRQQAGLLFDFSFKYIEKLENGRGAITPERFREFQENYGFSDREVEDLRSGKLEAPTDANCIRRTVSTDKRLDKRFRHKRITRECKVLKELRLRLNLDQYSASSRCGVGKNTIGWIENSRVTITDKKIKTIVEAYGFTMELFNQLLKVNPLRHEMIEQCSEIISSMDENKLRAIMPMLQSMNN